ncbi:hypothetical protein [Bacillus bombysepticus]|uniref:hypothetical protein n=1 Tax=Bacillus bombysepticus TaxID=658666 RepID=UPI003018C66D
MNLHLNDAQVKYLKDFLDNPSLQLKGLYKNSEDLTQELKSKLNKKKINKKAKLPSINLIDKSGKKFTLSPRKENGAIIITINKETYPQTKGFDGRYKIEWDFKVGIEIANYLHEYAIFTGDNDYTPNKDGIGDEIHVFKDEVERTVDFYASNLSFICYTDNTDDNWTYLVPSNVKNVLKMIVAYIFLHKELEPHFTLLHPEIQLKHNEWLLEQQEQLNINDYL